MSNNEDLRKLALLKNQKKNPNVRFPEFQAAGDWAVPVLKDISVLIDERVGDRKLTPISISAGVGFVAQTEKFGRDISGNQYKLYTVVRDGDFVYNKGNSLKFPQGCVYDLQGWGEVAAPNVFICFRLKLGYENGFFRYCFEKNIHGLQLKKDITSGARSNGLLNISKEVFFGVKIPTPGLEEQKKIAACLSSIDELITAEEKKHDALKVHKKGLMQALFPAEGETVPRLRFLEFLGAGEWRRQELDPFLLEYSERASSDTNLPVYSSTRTGLKFQKDYFDDRELENDGDYGVVPQGYFVYRHMSDDGLFKFNMNRTGGSIAVSKEYPVFSTSNLHPDFLLYLLNDSDAFKAFAFAQKKGGTRTRLYLKVLRTWKPLLPSLPEQKMIAGCLTSLDDAISVQSQKLVELRRHKNGLMQQLFPSVVEVK